MADPAAAPGVGTSATAPSFVPDWYQNFGTSVGSMLGASPTAGTPASTDAAGNPVAATPATTGTGALGMAANLANPNLTQAQGGFYNQPTYQGLSSAQTGLIDNASNIAGAWNTPFAAGTTTAGNAATDLGNATTSAGNIASGVGALGTNGQAGTGALGAMQTAIGGMGTAAEYDPNQMLAHLDPYTGQYMNTLAQQSQRNLTQNLLPAVNASFTGSGMFGSGRNSEFNSRALADEGQRLLETQNSALNTAYQNAASDYYNWGQLGEKSAVDQGTLGQSLATLPSDIYGKQASSQASLAQSQAALAKQQQDAALAAQQQRWTDTTNQYSLQESQRQAQQGQLDKNYQMWQDSINKPIDIMGALSKIADTSASLYKGNYGTTTTLPNTTGGNSASDLATILAAISQGFAGLPSGSQTSTQTVPAVTP